MNDTSETETKPALETDERFPSGPWTGFFLQPILPGRHWMELNLTFQNGSVSGEGRDWVGEFLIRGRYDTSDGKCWWSKRYLGRHDVAYLGYNEGRGIWGNWDIVDPPLKGGFHIWPKGMNMGGDNARSEEAELPAIDESAISFDDLGTESLETVGVGAEGGEPEAGPQSWN